MKKIIRIQGLDCANCAAKLERALQQIEGIEEASVSFMTQKIIIKAPDEIFTQVLEEAKTMIKKVEPDVMIQG